MECGIHAKKSVRVVFAIALGSLLVGVATEGANACEAGRYRVQYGEYSSLFQSTSSLSPIRINGVEYEASAGALSAAGEPPSVIRLENGELSIEGFCEASPARLRGNSNRLHAAARWEECAGGVSRVRLRVRVGPDCQRLRGFLHVADPRARARFKAERIPECGDGFVDVNETCDDGNADGTDCCSNSCEPSAAAVCARVPECGGETNERCPRREYCDFETGSCGEGDAMGFCHYRPRFCPRHYQPVCGCNGVTYANDCERWRARVAKESDGACADQVCGGFVFPPLPACNEGQVCDPMPSSCNIADLSGTCRDAPEVCPEVVAPVCDCNGVTHANDCERLRSGVAKHRDGVCEIACTLDSECGDGFFCRTPFGQCSAGGVCAPSFSMCTMEYDPVCGCNGRTYSNACNAQSHGVSVALAGECPGE